MISQEKLRYAGDMGFRFSIVHEGERRNSFVTLAQYLTNPISPGFDPLHTELIFVLSENDAVGFPDNVVAAWPSNDASRGMIIGIHLAISGNGRISPRYEARILADDINLEDFGLTYPLTFQQLVDDWENVAMLLSHFDPTTSGTIKGGTRDNARERGRTIMPPYNHMYHPMLNYMIEMRFLYWSGYGIDSLFVTCEETREELIMRELVFIHDREDAINVPNDIAVAWPRDIPWLERRIAGINSVIHRTADELMHRDRQVRDVINLEDFGLIYPITIEDTVDNWEGVARLWDALSYYEHRDINIAAAEE